MSSTGPIVFLDFDGVLNHVDWMRDHPHPRPPFDPACVARVVRICKAAKARIVVSSSWRCMAIRAKLPFLRGVLRGLGSIPVFGITPDLGGAPRADEIRAYLKRRPTDSFVILDDETGAGGGLEMYFVQTDFEKGGLLDEHADRAVRILGAR